MKTLEIFQIIISASLIIAILLQQRSSSLGSAFGGDSAVHTSRRGAERILYILTIILGIAFLSVAIAILVS